MFKSIERVRTGGIDVIQKLILSDEETNKS